MSSISSEVAAAQASSQAVDVARTPARREFLRKLNPKAIALQIAFAAAVIGLWQLLASTRVVDPFWTSEPSSIWSALLNELGSGTFQSAFGITLYETIMGFLISVVAGIVSGVVLFSAPLLFTVLRPFITLFNNLPRLVFAPLLVVYLGLGSWSRITLVISVVYVMVVLNTMAGLRSCEADHLFLAKAMGARRIATFVKFMLPSAIPSIFVSLQLGLTFAFLSAILGELMSGGDGLGSLISSDLSVYAFGNVFALLFIMAVVATIMSSLIRLLERRLLAWRRYEFRRHGGMS